MQRAKQKLEGIHSVVVDLSTTWRSECDEVWKKLEGDIRCSRWEYPARSFDPCSILCVLDMKMTNERVDTFVHCLCEMRVISGSDGVFQRICKFL